MPTEITTVDQAIDTSFAFGQDVLIGLLSNPKRIPSKWFYDAKGSKLFEKIMELPEYYLTECEFEILLDRGDDFLELLGGEPINLIEVGPGDGRKSRILLEHLLDQSEDVRYMPVEISEAALEGLIQSLEEIFPGLSISGLVADAFAALNRITGDSRRRNVLLLLGATFGNLSPADGRIFLRRLWNGLNAGDLMVIGFDLKKEIDLIRRAYDDPKGVTRQFNLNLLERVNRELGGHFDPASFLHYPCYNAKLGAMESYLISRRSQSVRIDTLDREFSFRPWEAIHTETSHKHLESDIKVLAEETGFRLLRNLKDSRGYFVDSVWSVEKR
jgi:dimethylhistidine N-methyltransferase